MPGRSPLRAAFALPGALLRAVAWALRAAVVSGRWVVVVAWLGGAVFAVLNPVPTDSGGSGNLSSLLPEGSAAVEVQQRSLGLFDVPVLSDTSVVVHDPGGLSVLTRADVTLRALAQTQAFARGDIPLRRGEVVGAVPLPTRSDETAVTYLYVAPYTSLAQTSALGRQYASHFDDIPGVQTYVTGVVPAQVQQAYHLEQRLRLFEVATLVLITVVVAITFRSVVAPVVVLVVAALGYFVAVWALGQMAAKLDFALPEELRPLIAALLIGVVTDYCVLFFSGFRRQLGRGLERREAARRTVLAQGPIVTVAGATTAAGTAALLVAEFELFRAFGPALALTVVVGVVVSLTLVPALMAILGSRLFIAAGGGQAAGPLVDRPPSRSTRWLARVVARPSGAVLAVLGTVALLVPAVLPLSDMRIDVSFTSELPDDDPVALGAQVLDEAGVRGVVAPTEVLIEAEDVETQRDGIERLQALLAREPGVAEVLGPAQLPVDDRYGIVFARSGDAARLVVIFDSDPLGAEAIDDFRRLDTRLGALAQAAGIEGAATSLTGQTAIASELAELTRENLVLVLLAALVVEFVLLALFLRAVLTPVLLLASSALGVAAALGLTVVVFQGALGNPGLIFFAPFTTAVLLLALGSDYNVFAVGSIWHEVRRLPLSSAIAVAMPATARAISTAGLILAATFAMVAIIPLGLFRQIAFTMTVGLLIDTFLIRPVLTPAVLTLLGRAAGWPGRRVALAPPPTAEEQSALIAGSDEGAAEDDDDRDAEAVREAAVAGGAAR